MRKSDCDEISKYISNSTITDYLKGLEARPHRVTIENESSLKKTFKLVSSR